MQAQFRRYQVKPGQMDAFVELWRDHVVPARQAYGFEVVSAWRSEDDAEFGWVVAFKGEGDFQTADRAYYSSSERAALPQDPISFLDQVETRMVDTL
jgi:heme-degrading monooxygenase HmoA